MYTRRCRSIHCLFYLCFWHAIGERWEMLEGNDDSDVGKNGVEAESEGNDVMDVETTTVILPVTGVTENIAELNSELNLIIRDVAYFLRAHKFQDFDRRFYHNVSKTPKRLYEAFPKPPLRSLHWEVKKYCEVGFQSCLRFLEKVVNLIPLRREDDTVTLMRDLNWTLPNNSRQINATQSDCLLAKKKDEITADPFQGPLERFRWRTSVSYYMCWYTMLGVPQLAHFGESCANYASCLDPSGLSSVDERVDDSKAYDCAMFSFCPDPCCPGLHLQNSTDCESFPKNPCYAGNEADKRTCVVRREDNQDFASMWKGHLNVTCHCDEPGYEWSTRYGICVDIDECSEKSNRCSSDATQTCVNLPGYYDCICHLGYVYNSIKKACVSSKSMAKILHRNFDAEKESTTESAFERIVNVITRSKASLVDTSLVMLIIPCFVSIRAR